LNTELAVKQLAALAQSSRLAIYRALVVAGETGNTPNELIALLGFGQRHTFISFKEHYNKLI